MRNHIILPIAINSSKDLLADMQIKTLLIDKSLVIGGLLKLKTSWYFK